MDEVIELALGKIPRRRKQGSHGPARTMNRRCGRLSRSALGRPAMRRLLVVLLAAVLIAAGGAGLWFWSYLTTAPDGRDEVVVVIPRGTGVRGIGAILAAPGFSRMTSAISPMCISPG